MIKYISIGSVSKKPRGTFKLHYSICPYSIGPLSDLSFLSQFGGLLESCQCLAADSFLGHELGGKSADFISAQIADTTILESCSWLLGHLFFSCPLKSKIQCEMKLKMRSIRVTLWFHHLETSGRNLTFCSLCVPSCPAPPEPCESFLGMTYSLKCLHKLLKQSVKEKARSVEPMEFNRRQILGFCLVILGLPTELWFSGLHSVGGTGRHSRTVTLLVLTSWPFPDSSVQSQ